MFPLTTRSMKLFNIFRQYRASSSYQQFLGRFHFNYICCIIYNSVAGSKIFTHIYCKILNKYLFVYLASFRVVLSTNKQIHRLNQNAIVPLSDDRITIEKVAINIRHNPSTTFLAPTNAAVNSVNQDVVEVLFSDHTPLMTVINGQQIPIPIYRNMALVITENRNILFLFYVL